MDKKVLTAEKIIGMADNLIRLIENGQLQIITYPEMRAGSNPYSQILLKKKFLLHNGILQFALNKDDEAQDLFLECMATGDKMVDPRFRPECLTRIQIILTKKYDHAPSIALREKYQDQMNSVQSFLRTYKVYDRDYVFLVNDDIKAENNDIAYQILNSIKIIFKHHIKPEDRISLMNYGKNTKRLFNLVNT